MIINNIVWILNKHMIELCCKESAQNFYKLLCLQRNIVGNSDWWLAKQEMITASNIVSC